MDLAMAVEVYSWASWLEKDPQRDHRLRPPTPIRWKNLISFAIKRLKTAFASTYRSKSLTSPWRLMDVDSNMGKAESSVQEQPPASSSSNRG